MDRPRRAGTGRRRRGRGTVRRLPGTGDGDEAPAEQEQEEARDGEAGEETSGTICVDTANLRGGQSTEHPIVASLTNGDEVLYTVDDVVEDWVRLVGSESCLHAGLLCGR